MCKCDRSSPHLIGCGASLFQLPVLTPGKHTFVFMVACKDIPLFAESPRHPVTRMPGLRILDLYPYIFAVRCLFRALKLQGFQIRLRLRVGHFTVTRFWQYPELKNARTFQHSLKVFRIVKSSADYAVGIE